MLVIKKRQFYTVTVNLYALIHAIITTGFALGFGKTGNSAYFAIDNTNLIFMIVLSAPPQSVRITAVSAGK